MPVGLVGLAFLIAAAMACSRSSEQSPATGESSTVAASIGKIAFVSDRDGFPNIYAVNSDGTELTRLTNNSAGDGDVFPEAEDQYGFAWSPDGKRMVFETAREEFLRWYVMNSDGSNQTILTEGLLIEPDSVPSWSPDGKRIAVMGLNKGICVVNSDGTDLQCTDISYTAALTWSPDGDVLAFLTIGEDENARVNDVSIMAPDGSRREKIAENASYDSLLSWSPDGSSVVFNSHWGLSADISADIYIAHKDGSGVKRLTENDALDVHPAWSPRGDRIAFSSTRDGNSEIYVMNTEGSDLVRLTKSDVQDVLPSWSPDGNQIAFVSLDEAAVEAGEKGYGADIYVVNADGSGLTLVADSIAGYAFPQWQPRD